MKLDNWLSRSAAVVPDRIALVEGDDRLTYRELERRATGAARRLAGLGVERGDRVAILLEPSVEYVALLHGLMKLGAVAVPLDPTLPDAELEDRIEQTRASLALRDPQEIGAGAEADFALDATSDAEATNCVIYTSGTGGRAKPVALTYANHLWSALASGARIGVQAEDRWLCCLPLHHVGGLAIVLRSAVYGTGLVLDRFAPRETAATIERERVTVASLVATMLARLLEEASGLEPLRCLLLGGGPAPADVLQRALERALPLAPTYGLTEAASQVATLPPGEARARPGSAGPPLLPTRVRIDGEGAILVSGPTVAPSAAGADGWLRTGDRGRLEDGHLYVLGRADDVIVTGGEKVHPEEVEEALLAHPAVADAGVTWREDREWQQAVVAIVVLRAGARADEAELRDFCRRRLARHKVPKRVQFSERLPRDGRGKLRRSELGG